MTGASSGLGQSLASLALERGDIVIGTFRSPHQAAQFEREAPGRAVGCEIDLAEAGSIGPALEAAVGRAGGRVDVVVNNAGYGLQGAVEEISEAQGRRVMEANFFGALQVIRTLLPGLRAQRAGHIVNVSSIGGFVGMPGLGLYCASKFALEGLSESLRRELAPLGIHVTIVEPGALRTRWAAGGMDSAETSIDDYSATSMSLKLGLEKQDGNQRGDPKRAAAAIMSCVNSPTPPLRLVIGPDCLGMMRAHLGLIEADLATWEEVSVSTDFAS